MIQILIQAADQAKEVVRFADPGTWPVPDFDTFGAGIQNYYYRFTKTNHQLMPVISAGVTWLGYLALNVIASKTKSVKTNKVSELIFRFITGKLGKDVGVPVITVPAKEKE